MDRLNEKIASIYWALQSDTTAARESFDKMSYARALKILKLVDSNVDGLFHLQQKMDALHQQKDQWDSEKEQWKKYSEDTRKVAITLDKFGNYIYNSLPSANTQKNKKIFSVLAQKTLRMSGKAYEHSGYASGKAGRNKHAAKIWTKAAEVSKLLVKINKETGGKASGATFSEYQAAARLHRASYFWMMHKNIKRSVAKLDESKRFLGSEAKQNIDFLVEAESDTEESDAENRRAISGVNR